MKYSSAAVYHPNGDFMFYCDQRRAQWYLTRNIAKVLVENENRIEIQLLFEPKGPGPAADDEFNRHEIIQRCVVCGTVNDLTKHHIVPSCYKKYFPIEYKSRINHDVVIVCENHHHVYEDLANVLKDRLAEKYQIPNLTECAQMQSPTSNPLLKKFNLIKSLCNSYLKHIDNQEISDKIYEKLLTMNIDPKNQDIHIIMNETDSHIEIIKSLSTNFDHGQLMVSKLDDIDKFIKMWRKHFIDNMAPNFMPRGWSIQYKTKMNVYV